MKTKKILLQYRPDFSNYIGYRYLHKVSFLDLYEKCISLNDDKIYFTMNPDEQPFDASFSWAKPDPNIRIKFKCVMFDDFHYDRPELSKNRHSLFKNSHAIFSPNTHQATKINNSEFDYTEDKLVFFPYFARSEDIIPRGSEKINKCLLHGTIPVRNDAIYTLRQRISEYSKKTDNIEVLSKSLDIWGVDYIKHLSKYNFVFSVLNGSIEECNPYGRVGSHYLLMKHIETLSSGSAMIADEKPAFKDMGLVPYEHYIPCTYSDFATEDSAKSFMDKLMKMPLEKVNHIIDNGQKLLREKHTSLNRAVQIYNFFLNI